ncbi:MAG TPA: hypothetical protein PK883_08120 [Anaerolineaceae bacterium]|jgi:hypothetical protein|nr:hypothetical protein [Anaerolineaceae bacterium]
MAKKTKKRSVSSSAEATPKAAVVTEAAAAKASAFRAAEFNPDYSYVKKDLKRIGMLAGSFFVILLVLSFFLR